MSLIQAVLKNPTRSLKNVTKAAATVIVNKRILAWAAGLAVEATSATIRADVIGVSNQDIAASDNLTQVPVIETFEKDVWIADSTNNSNAVHNGQLMVIGANGGLINNTGTTNAAGVVQQVDVYGPAANKQILVTFIQ